MATSTKRRAQYHGPNGGTYGSLAYAEGGALVRPAPGGAEVLRPRPKAVPKERAARPKVKVREQGKISVFAVVGFLAVGVFAALLLLSYVRLTVAADQVATLHTELSNLEKEQSKLMAQYELAFDLSTIEAAVTADGSMVKPQSDQIVMVDLSEPNRVVRFQQEQPKSENEIVSEAKGIWDNILAYFK